MADTVNCPVCQGSGMAGASSCGRCRGTGSVKTPDATFAMPALEAAVAPPEEISPEVRQIVEEELDNAMHHTQRLKLRGRSVKLSAGPRRGGKGLSFKN